MASSLSPAYLAGIVVPIDTMGLNRIDNNIGYSLDNCTTACVQCNWAKGGLSLGEFQEWIRKVYKNVVDV